MEIRAGRIIQGRNLKGDAKMKRNILLVISLIAMFATSTYAEEPVEFGDANLKAAVEKVIMVTNPVPSQLKKLTTLTVNSKEISDITGLEHATNLTSLCLHSNQIQDISALSGSTKLQNLCLKHNQISDISVLANMGNLTVLNLWKNQITDITAVSDLPELTELWLAENKIGDISALSSLTKLEKLFVFRCEISNISAVAGLENLKGLSLHHNKVSDISPVAKLVNLEFLWLGANEISDISAVAGLTDLPKLSFYENQVSDISALAGLGKLTLLEMHNNKIIDISVLTDKTNLAMLKLYDNQITDASPAVSLPKLKSLSLKGNPVKTLGKPLSEIQNQGIKFELSPALYTNLVISEQEDHSTGNIRIDKKIKGFVVSRQGREILIVPEDKETVLPTGDYNYVRWSIEEKDKDNNKWLLTGSGFSRKASFAVVANEVTELKAGEPIVGTLRAVAMSSGYHKLSQSIKGSLGETVSILKNGSKPEAPSVRIVNADISYDKTFKFKYG